MGKKSFIEKDAYVWPKMMNNRRCVSSVQIEKIFRNISRIFFRVTMSTSKWNWNRMEFYQIIESINQSIEHLMNNNHNQL